jgi:predicted transcriptional regulator
LHFSKKASLKIFDYILNNPGKTENEMMLQIYGYDRPNSKDSNKKYADRLRCLLDKGIISRVKAETSIGKRYIYFAVSKVFK